MAPSIASLLPWLDMVGIAVFAASGALAAARKRLDFVGACFFALIAAGTFVALTGAGLPAPWPAILGFGSGFALRGAAIRWQLALPPHPGN